MNKYYQAITNSAGDSLSTSRVQVNDSLGAAVSIYADNGGTPFTDETGANVNYCEADSTGMVQFYWVAATGQVLQIRNAAGDLEREISDFANNFVSTRDAVDVILGVDVLDADMGAYTGTTITDDGTVKENIQELETATELRPTSATLAAVGGGALIGTADGSTAEAKLVRLDGEIDTVRPITFAELGTFDILTKYPGLTSVTISDRGYTKWIPDSVTNLSGTYSADENLWWAADAGAQKWRVSGDQDVTPAALGIASSGNVLPTLNSYVVFIKAFGKKYIYDASYEIAGAFVWAINNAMIELRNGAEFISTEKLEPVIKFSGFRANTITGPLRAEYKSTVTLTATDTTATAFAYTQAAGNTFESLYASNVGRGIGPAGGAGSEFSFSNTCPLIDIREWKEYAIRLTAQSGGNTGSAFSNVYLNNSYAAGTGTASKSGTTLTVSAIATGNVALGDFVYGATDGFIGTVNALGTGTGGTGTYTVTTSATVTSQAVTFQRAGSCTGFVYLATTSETTFQQLNCEWSKTTGPAIYVAGDCHYVGIEGLHFEGFSPAQSFGGIIDIAAGPVVKIGGLVFYSCVFDNANAANINMVRLAGSQSPTINSKCYITGLYVANSTIISAPTMTYARNQSGTAVNASKLYLSGIKSDDAFTVSDGNVVSGMEPMLVQPDLIDKIEFPGDADGSVFSSLAMKAETVFDVPITATRTQFLSSTAYKGQQLTVSRTPDATGAFNVTITATGMTTVTFAASASVQRAVFVRNATAWRRIG
jgi:hypothetical protein